MLKIIIPITLISVISCATTYKDQRASSTHFKDGAFVNLEAQENKTFWSFLKMRLNTEWPSWPDKIEPQFVYDRKNPLAERINGDEIHLTHINHSTVLIQTGGLNILTDPIYSERCSPVSFAGPKRVRPPGIEFKDLPKIDIVLISHDHYDHLDVDTIKQLAERDNPKFFVGLGVGRLLADYKNVTELDWWQSQKFSDTTQIHFVPVQHFSGRGLFDRNSTLWGGFFIQIGSRKIYFGGDTGYAGHFLETKRRLGSPDLAILPIGAYAPRDFMKPVHMDPAEAVQAHIDLEAKVSFGVHYGTFQLTSESIDEPIKLLADELELKKIDKNLFLTADFGRTLIIK